MFHILFQVVPTALIILFYILKMFTENEKDICWKIMNRGQREIYIKNKYGKELKDSVHKEQINLEVGHYENSMSKL